MPLSVRAAVSTPLMTSRSVAWASSLISVPARCSRWQTYRASWSPVASTWRIGAPQLPQLISPSRGVLGVVSVVMVVRSSLYTRLECTVEILRYAL